MKINDGWYLGDWYSLGFESLAEFIVSKAANGGLTAAEARYLRRYSEKHPYQASKLLRGKELKAIKQALEGAA